MPSRFPFLRPAPGSRNSFFFLICVFSLAVYVVMRMPSSEPPVEDIPYSVFIRGLEKGEYIKVELNSGSNDVKATLAKPLGQGSKAVRYVHAVLPVYNSDYVLTKVDEAGVIVESKTPGPSAFDRVVSFLPLLLFGAFMLYIIRASNPTSRLTSMLGPSRNKLITEVPLVRFADVAGADEAKQELSEMVDFLKDPLAMTSLGGRMPKGALLIGAPGTGKTLLARAVAGEAGRPFFSMSGSDFVEMFVGVGASRVRGLFDVAKKNAPCIIFIDEIDAVGRARGSGMGGGSDEREQTLNQLLVEMDGFEPSSGVVVLAATNRPDVLDAALLRPGRFDRQVNIDLPNTAGRLAILTVHAKKVSLDPGVDLLRIARGTPGMSGADLANLLNEAAVLAARSSHQSIMTSDLESAKDKLILGLERKSLILSSFERRLTAYHEAGHAIVALVTKGSDPLHKVTIIPRGRALGVTATLPDVDRHMYTKKWLKDHIVMLFGGRAAEEIIFGKEEITTGAQSDIQRATDVARDIVASFGMTKDFGMMNVPASSDSGAPTRSGSVSQATMQQVDAEVRKLLAECYDLAVDILTGQQFSLELLTQGLLEHDTLSREEILALLPIVAALPHHSSDVYPAPVPPPPPVVA